MTMHLVAVDLGASSGRVMVGRYADERVKLEEYHRFDNELIVRGGHHCWDIDAIFDEVKQGIDKVLASGIVPAGIAIDSWGVDFVLTDKQGERVGESVSYRDARTLGIMEKVFGEIPQGDIYRKTGIQFLPFNTLYQLKALIDEQPGWLDRVATLQFIPDYLSFRLSGETNCEYTNATTSQLVNCQTGSWDKDLVEYIGIPSNWLLEPKAPCRQIGHYQVDGHRIPVLSVASHDTAAAVAAVPFSTPDAAYISSGTWSLMGIELMEAVTDEFAHAINITNEGGVEKRFRVLKNIMGLWLIQRVKHELNDYSFAELVSEAKGSEAFRSLVNPDDQRFLNPESMVGAIQGFCRETGQPVPETVGELARCVFESLAMQYRKVYLDLTTLSARDIETIHIVGGGCQNEFLNQLCADACQCDVAAGPIEASALGNLTCQLIALGELADLDEARAMIARSFPLKTFTPNPASEFETHWQWFKSLSNN